MIKNEKPGFFFIKIMLSVKNISGKHRKYIIKCRTNVTIPSNECK